MLCRAPTREERRWRPAASPEISGVASYHAHGSPRARQASGPGWPAEESESAPMSASMWHVSSGLTEHAPPAKLAANEHRRAPASSGSRTLGPRPQRVSRTRKAQQAEYVSVARHYAGPSASPGESRSVPSSLLACSAVSRLGVPQAGGSLAGKDSSDDSSTGSNGGT